MIKELIKIANELDNRKLLKEADYLDSIIKLSEEPTPSSDEPRKLIEELFSKDLMVFTHATGALNKNNFQDYLAQGHRVLGDDLGHTFANTDSFEDMEKTLLPGNFANQLAYGSNVVIMSINKHLGSPETMGIIDPNFDPKEVPGPFGSFSKPKRWAGIFKEETHKDEWYGEKFLIDGKFIFGLWEYENGVIHLNPNFEPNEPTESGLKFINNYALRKEKEEALKEEDSNKAEESPEAVSPPVVNTGDWEDKDWVF